MRAGAKRANLEHVTAQRGGTLLLTYAYSILGVLLFGSGIVTCFAANWGKIPKLISDPSIPSGYHKHDRVTHDSRWKT